MAASSGSNTPTPKRKIYGQPPPQKDLGIGGGTVSAMRLTLMKQGFMGSKTTDDVPTPKRDPTESSPLTPTPTRPKMRRGSEMHHNAASKHRANKTLPTFHGLSTSIDFGKSPSGKGSGMIPTFPVVSETPTNASTAAAAAAAASTPTTPATPAPSAAATPVSATATPPSTPADAPYSPWLYWTDANGKNFYFNEKTKATQWSKPDGYTGRTGSTNPTPTAAAAKTPASAAAAASPAAGAGAGDAALKAEIEALKLKLASALAAADSEREKSTALETEVKQLKASNAALTKQNAVLTSDARAAEHEATHSKEQISNLRKELVRAKRGGDATPTAAPAPTPTSAPAPAPAPVVTTVIETKIEYKIDPATAIRESKWRGHAIRLKEQLKQLASTHRHLLSQLAEATRLLAFKREYNLSGEYSLLQHHTALSDQKSGAAAPAAAATSDSQLSRLQDFKSTL